ncbi:MAG TPA: amidinotransferase [Bdellovibrionales bacterium]|nr:amidinotransferase [Bdellovibrionales bacterium]
MWPVKVLMAHPAEFQVSYSINPYMKDEAGKLNQVDVPKAIKQWEALRDLFTHLGMAVQVLDAVPGLPDMVFTANQSFPFVNAEGRPSLLMSRMKSPFRQPEVEHFRTWAMKNKIQTYELKTSGNFEGMGDALWDYEAQEIFGGFGPRTSVEVYDQIRELTGKPVHLLKLVDERFYHLDTCLCLLGNSIAFAVREAFDEEGWSFLRTHFQTLKEIPLKEALENFAGNMLALGRQQIVMQSGAHQTKANLEKLGYQIHEVETSEFMKSGGSVFCMKLLYF